jgi:hypothetical protein
MATITITENVVNLILKANTFAARITQVLITIASLSVLYFNYVLLYKNLSGFVDPAWTILGIYFILTLILVLGELSKSKQAAVRYCHYCESVELDVNGYKCRSCGKIQ